MRLIERFNNAIARRRLAQRTRECYWGWIVEFLKFHRTADTWRQPRELNETHVEAFLTHLAVQKKVSASTQNQALCALVFLYKQVVVDEVGEKHLGRFEAERARRPVRVPTVLSQPEVARLLATMRAGSVQRLLGHSHLETTMVYTHVMNKPSIAVRSPLDGLECLAIAN